MTQHQQETAKQTCIWIHEDMLDPNHPIYQYPHHQVAGIFDTEAMHKKAYSLKRCVFIYECFCACPLNLYRGASFDVLSNLISENHYTTILTAPSPNPEIIKTISQLRNNITVNLVAEKPFAGNPNAKLTPRFMKYWWQIRQKVIHI